MKKVLAISGGVDSMCLLHMLKDDKDVVVAHFNHGTRPSADDDEKFVASYAKKYGLPFYSEKAQLGADVSEADARSARYAFLKKLSQKLDGKIFTAHHQNDLFESIAINLLRGTGWRGLTPFYDAEIERPMLKMSKSEIYQYATEHQIVFRQDPTNVEEKYLRNRLRFDIADFARTISANKLQHLFTQQRVLRAKIEDLASGILPYDSIYSRSLFKDLDNSTAEELLRAILARSGISATRPQLDDFLHAIKTYESGKKFNLPKDQLVKFNKTEFML